MTAPRRRVTGAMIVLALAAGCGACAGCAGSGRAAAISENRAQLLRRLLLERDQPMLVRDASRVQAKYARMAHDTFSFYRGISWMLPREPSRFETPAARAVAVIGDPHPENVGTFVTGSGEAVVDFNDFDLAGHGSYLDDLRRLALSLWIAADMADVRKKQRSKVVAHAVDGYLTELRTLAAGKPGISLRVATAFDGDLEAVLIPADVDDTDAGRGEAVSPAEEDLVKKLLARYPATLHHPERFRPTMFAPRRIVRRSLGIGSFPVQRYRVVVEGPTDAPGDDWTLELKESPGSGRAALIVAIQRQFQEFPDDDPLLGWAAHEKQEFRVRRVSSEQRRMDVQRIARQVKSPRWGKRDLKDLAFDLGRLLARGHARARAADGRPGLAALTAAVGSGQGLAVEVAGYVSRHAAQTESDLDHFRALLQQQGPLLGWKP